MKKVSGLVMALLLKLILGSCMTMADGMVEAFPTDRKVWLFGDDLPELTISISYLVTFNRQQEG